jgi:hypothetical protein
MVSGVAVDGPGIDAAAADRPQQYARSGLAHAAACGDPGPQWAPIEGIAAAGFQKFTSSEPIQGAAAGMEALYSTHCFATDGGKLALQIPVVPNSQLRVVLHFAEVFFTVPGKRMFDVLVDGVMQVRPHAAATCMHACMPSASTRQAAGGSCDQLHG